MASRSYNATDLDQSLMPLSALFTRLMILLIGLIILSPEFVVLENFYRPRGEDFIILILAALLYPVLLKKKSNGTPNQYELHPSLRIGSILLAMFYGALISICIGTLAFGQQLTLNDWMILPMIVRYWLIFQLGRLVGKYITRDRFIWVLLLVIACSAFIGILQRFNLLGINEWFTPMYVGESMQLVGLELLLVDSPDGRVVGSHGDPRHYAYILVVGVGLSLAILFKSSKSNLWLTALIVMGMCILSIIFSGSRTAILSVVAIFSFTVLQQIRQIGCGPRIVSLLLTTPIMLAIAWGTISTFELEFRGLDLSGGSFDASFSARQRDLLMPFQDAMQDPVIFVIGRGPSKVALRTDSHNDFGWYFLRFGGVGLVLYLLLLGHSFLVSWRARFNPANDTEQQIIIMLTGLVLVIWGIFAMAENIFKDPQLMALNMLVLGAFVPSTYKTISPL